MADLVDLDRDSGTGVFWHCGLAPLDMADPEDATPCHHPRGKPEEASRLAERIPAKTGTRITIARLSQARNEPSCW